MGEEKFGIGEIGRGTCLGDDMGDLGHDFDRVRVGSGVLGGGDVGKGRTRGENVRDASVYEREFVTTFSVGEAVGVENALAAIPHSCYEEMSL